MTLAGRSRFSVIPLEDAEPMVYLRGGLGETVSEYPDMFWSYGAIDAAMDDVNAHVVSLKADINTNLSSVMSTADGQRFYTDWVGFFAEWLTWYQQNRRGVTGTAGSVSGAVQASLRRLAARYNSFDDRFVALGFRPTPVGHQPQTPNVLSTEAWVGIGIGAGVLALGFIAWGLHSVSAVAAPIARSGTRGRKR